MTQSETEERAVDLLEFRAGKLTAMSGHYRELAVSLFPETVSGEIAAVADVFEDEVVRMMRECLGRRACPCEMGDSCTALITYDPALATPARQVSIDFASIQDSCR